MRRDVKERQDVLDLCRGHLANIIGCKEDELPEFVPRIAREAEARKKKPRPPQTPEERRRYQLKSKYGITPEQYEEMERAQDGLCAICFQPPGKRRLHVDHDHATDAVRELLCTKCNLGLGAFRDDENVLFQAVRYLRKHAA